MTTGPTASTTATSEASSSDQADRLEVGRVHRPWCQRREHEAAGTDQCFSCCWEWHGISVHAVAPPAPEAVTGPGDDIDLVVHAPAGGVVIPAAQRDRVRESFEVWLLSSVGDVPLAAA